MQCSLKPLARFTAVALSAWFKSAKTRIQESSRTPPGRGGPQPQASWEVFIGGDLLSNHPQRTGDAEVGVGHVRHAEAVHADDGAAPAAPPARQQPHQRGRRASLLRHPVQRRQALLQVRRVQAPPHAVVFHP